MAYDNNFANQTYPIDIGRVRDQEGSELSGGQDTMVFGKMIPTRTQSSVASS